MARSILRLGLSAAGLAGLLWWAHWLASIPPGAQIERREMREIRAADGGDGLAERWLPFDDARLATWRGPYELRYHVRLAAKDTAAPLGLHVALRAAFTATWDGVPLPANGMPGISRIDERPGQVDWVVPVPAGQSASGVHELRLVASSHAMSRPLRSSDARVRVAPYGALVAAATRAWIVPLVALGAVLAGWIYVAAILVRSRHSRRLGWLLLGTAGSGMLLTLAEAWRDLVGYPYPWHTWRLMTVLGLTVLTMTLMAGYFSTRHSTATRLIRVPPRGLLLLPTLIGLAFPLGLAHFDTTVWLVHLSGLASSLFFAARTSWLANSGEGRSTGLLAVLLLTALGAAVVTPSAYIDGLYSIALAVLMAVVLLMHATQQRDAAARALTLEASRARLTNALLKRSIQPHWLMNTLTSLQELIEVDPPRASRLVDLLGEEFRLFTASSTQPVIPATRELALCHTHLAIVSMALSAPRHLHVEGADLLEGVGVPPGVLHTLVENALTHGGVQTPAGGRDFQLEVRRSGTMLCLALTTPSSRAMARTFQHGTGTQFVESSLESIFPSNWAFSQGPVDGGWQSTIMIPEADARRALATRTVAA